MTTKQELIALVRGECAKNYDNYNAEEFKVLEFDIYDKPDQFGNVLAVSVRYNSYNEAVYLFDKNRRIACGMD
jgi:hypothetical protein